MIIGVLALQGAFKEHKQMLEKCGVDSILVRKPEELSEIDGLIIPGGESTTIGKLIMAYDLDKIILEKAEKGMPIFGTCAGMILLAKEIEGSNQFSLGLMDIKVGRNTSCCQVNSFEVKLQIDAIGKVPFPAIFNKAPYIVSLGPNIGILAEHKNKAVMARQGNILVTSFHTELTNDLRVHLYFKEMVQDAKNQ